MLLASPRPENCFHAFKWCSKKKIACFSDVRESNLDSAVARLIETATEPNNEVSSQNICTRCATPTRHNKDIPYRTPIVSPRRYVLHTPPTQLRPPFGQTGLLGSTPPFPEKCQKHYIADATREPAVNVGETLTSINKLKKKSSTGNP